MPMDFPDMQSLRDAATAHNFRQPHEDEPEDNYRNALADHVFRIDRVESAEIRNKVGWDKFTPQQAAEMVFGTAVTRAEHMRWCKERAMIYAEKGDAENTVLSMVSDLGKHAGTARTTEVASLVGLALLMGTRTKEACIKWVNDFHD